MALNKTSLQISFFKQKRRKLKSPKLKMLYFPVSCQSIFHHKWIQYAAAHKETDFSFRLLASHLLKQSTMKKHFNKTNSFVVICSDIFLIYLGDTSTTSFETSVAKTRTTSFPHTSGSLSQTTPLHQNWVIQPSIQNNNFSRILKFW